MLSLLNPGRSVAEIRALRSGLASVPTPQLPMRLSNSLGADVRPASRESTISSRVLFGVVDAVERAGVSRAHLLAATDVDPARFDTPDARVSRAELYRICEAALDLTGDPAFGLHWAQNLGDRVFVPVSHLIAHAASLRDGFELLARFSPLLADESDYVIEEREGAIVLRCLPLEGESDRLERMAKEMMVGGFYRLVRSFGGETRHVRATFAYPAPEHADEYARFFGEGVRFDAPFTGLAFDPGLMNRPSPAKDDDVREALVSIAQHRLMRVIEDVPVASRVRDFLVREGFPHRTDMKSVARALGMSVRSLRRRLDEEDVPFDHVLDDALGTVAKQLLRDPRRSIQDVSFEMGFSEASAFHRAFKRWTGTTPQAWRDGSR